MAVSAKERKQTENVLDWLVECVGEAEADGYQQAENSKSAWCESPPEIINGDWDQLFVNYDGWEFLLKVRRVRKLPNQ